MYCRKCLKKDSENKVVMESNIGELCYICPKCGNKINWITKEGGEG